MNPKGSLSRSLLIVGGSGVGLALICFVAARSLGPIGGLGWPDGDGMGHDFFRGPTIDGGGASVTRKFEWSGEDELQVHIPATVIYTQGPETSLEVTGGARTLDHFKVDGDSVGFDRKLRNAGRVAIHLTAPSVNSFILYGAQELRLDGYDQDRLDVQVHGAGDVIGHGRAARVEVKIMGAGDVDLGAMKSESAEVEIMGAGDATVAPSDSLEVKISGAGDVTLMSDPPSIESHIMGAGRIIHDGDREPDPDPDPLAGSKTSGGLKATT